MVHTKSKILRAGGSAGCIVIAPPAGTLKVVGQSVAVVISLTVDPVAEMRRYLEIAQAALTALARLLEQHVNVESSDKPLTLMQRSGRKSPSVIDLKPTTEDIAKAYPPGATPPFKEVMGKMKAHWPDLTRDVARRALKTFAPQLRGRRGYKTKSR
jgi:hypothetical protein